VKRLLWTVLILICFVETGSAFVADSSAQKIRKNSVYYEFFGNGLWSGSINYDLRIPVAPDLFVSIRAGLAWYERFFPLAGASLLIGNKHSLECGTAYTAFHEGDIVFLRLGYRYSGNKGLIIRAAPLYSLSQRFTWFGVSAGYSF